MSSGLLTRDEGSVRVLTLSRPPGNTLDPALVAALREAVQAAADAPGVRAIVIDSDVPRYFSSGLDLEALMSLPESRRTEPFMGLFLAYRTLLSCPKPTVAAISGSALLGGWVVAMACDWRLLARGAKVSLAEIRAGLTPTSALIGRLSALAVDPRAVKEMVLRGKALTAEEALAAGIVDEVLDEALVRPEGLALAQRLTKVAPRAFASAKRALTVEASNESHWDRALQEFTILFSGEEAREGLDALRAKRRPRWE